MRHLPQDLRDIVPAAANRLQQLKETNRRFRSLAERDAALDDENRCSETGLAPAMDDAHAEGLNKQRLARLDQIAAVLEGEKP